MKIIECVRKSGITYLNVSGPDPVKATDAGRLIDVEGVAEKTVNGRHKILAVIPPDTIRIAQPGLQDIPAGITGGSVIFDGVRAAGAPAPAPHAAGTANHVPPKTTWAKPAKK